MLLKDGCDSYDEKRVTVMGGSHGGYLGAYLSAKYPETFIGAILENPVIDLPSKKYRSIFTLYLRRYDGYFRYF